MDVVAAAEPRQLQPERGYISGLREQIKSNAGVLFQYGPARAAGPQMDYDVAIMTHTADDSMPSSSEKIKYQAVLTYAGSLGDMRKGTIAAKGRPSNDATAALEALLLVTATALEKFQGNVCKDASAPAAVADGMIDEALVYGKSWKSMFKK